ncbi:MAG: DUF502 domain-containing protein [Candidatus Omnitrophica bacterium]|nr:DUF502 domain-containing protein [Candidatus Omnitrophota bacterium]
MTLETSIPRRRRWTEYFVTGLLILAPAYITFLVIRFIVGQIERLFHPVFRWLDPYITSTWATVLLQASALLAFLVGVTVIGWGTRILLLRQAFSAFEARIARLPVVGRIYAATREVTKAFDGEQKTAFSRVVLIEWPGRGHYTLGFVTHDDTPASPSTNHMVHVLLPSTPNPATGFLVFVDRKAVIPVDLSVEDALKLAISGGLVGPGVVPPRPAPPAEDR